MFAEPAMSIPSSEQTADVFLQVTDQGSVLQQLQEQLASTEQQQLRDGDTAMARYAELELALQTAEEHLQHDQSRAAELQKQLDEASAQTQASCRLQPSMAVS